MIEFTIEKTIKIKVRVKEVDDEIKIDAVAMLPNVGILLPAEFVKHLDIMDVPFSEMEGTINKKGLQKLMRMI